MTALKIAILMALGIVLLKFIASLLGKGDIPWLNQVVTAILSLFVAFELFKLAQALLEKFV
jgi:uncharacterized membrane protein (DUF373 family)